MELVSRDNGDKQNDGGDKKDKGEIIRSDVVWEG